MSQEIYKQALEEATVEFYELSKERNLVNAEIANLMLDIQALGWLIGEDVSEDIAAAKRALKH